MFDTLQANLGSVYVNDFNKFGKTYQVKIQADANFRSHAEDINRLAGISTVVISKSNVRMRHDFTRAEGLRDSPHAAILPCRSPKSKLKELGCPTHKRRAV